MLLTWLGILRNKDMVFGFRVQGARGKGQGSGFRVQGFTTLNLVP